MIIGLTGISGSGKTLAANFFREKGFYVIDFDLISRQVCQKDSPCLSELTSYFGGDILDGEGNLKRKYLGKIVFEDAKKLEVLNSITHKYIFKEAQNQYEENKDKDIVLDAPLLFETEMDKNCDCVLSIVASREILVRRIMERDGIDEKAALARLNSQHDREFFMGKSDFCIENNSHIQEFYEKLNNFLKELSNGSYYK